MNTRLNARTVLAATAALLAAATTALAGTVGGSVTAINTLATPTFANAITIGTSVPGNDNSQTDRIIVSSTIDNNSDTGWRLTVVSGNVGRLLKGGSNVAGSRIIYTNVKLVKTGGTLGDGLVDPDGQNKNIVTGANGGGVAGTTKFSTGGAALPAAATATTATEGYAFDLKISWSSDTSLLGGTYSDTITLSLANDS